MTLQQNVYNPLKQESQLFFINTFEESIYHTKKMETFSIQNKTFQTVIVITIFSWFYTSLPTKYVLISLKILTKGGYMYVKKRWKMPKIR